jgi:hypothetical protein
MCLFLLFVFFHLLRLHFFSSRPPYTSPPSMWLTPPLPDLEFYANFSSTLWATLIIHANLLDGRTFVAGCLIWTWLQAPTLPKFLHLGQGSQLWGPLGRECVCVKQLCAFHLPHPLSCCWAPPNQPTSPLIYCVEVFVLSVIVLIPFHIISMYVDCLISTAPERCWRMSGDPAWNLLMPMPGTASFSDSCSFCLILHERWSWNSAYCRFDSSSGPCKLWGFRHSS